MEAGADDGPRDQKHAFTPKDGNKPNDDGDAILELWEFDGGFSFVVRGRLYWNCQ